MTKQPLIITLITLCFCFTIEAQEGWGMLFNGKDFSNFEQLNGNAIYKIENGEMIGISIMNTPNSFMVTKKKYGDFILVLRRTRTSQSLSPTRQVPLVISQEICTRPTRSVPLVC